MLVITGLFLFVLFVTLFSRIYKMLQKKLLISTSGRNIKDKTSNSLNKAVKNELKTSHRGLMMGQLENVSSIIDVTYQMEALPVEPQADINETTLDKSVPYWAHVYIYSFSDLRGANSVQREFYYKFKNNFLNHDYIDLSSNFNYAFILMFDLFENDFIANQDLNFLERMVFCLIENYPITKPYALRNLIRLMQENNADENIQNMKAYLGNEYYQWESGYYNARVKLGNKFKSKLNLSDSEVKLLNKNIESSNVFLQIEFCYISVIKFYLIVIEEMDKIFKKTGSSLEKEFRIIAEVDYYKEQDYYGNFEKSIQSMIDYLYTYVMFISEVEVRRHYSYNRKKQDYFMFQNKTREAVNQWIDPVINKVILSQKNNILELDEDTTILLNQKSPNRWKATFNEISTVINVNTINDYYRKIIKLAELNKKVAQNIYFEAFKKATKINSEVAIKIYLLYLVQLIN